MIYPKSISALIEQFQKFPSVGPKSAQRMAFYLLKMPVSEVEKFAKTLVEAKQQTKACEICYNLSTTNPCEICSSQSRDKSTICVVAETKDLIAIGGCMGSIYLVNLKNKHLIANVNIRYKNEIITCIHLIENGDIVCGTSMILKDNDTQREYICPNIVQFRYDNQVFREVRRKKNVHEDVIEKIIEIVNHKGINEFATVSIDGSFKVWD